MGRQEVAVMLSRLYLAADHEYTVQRQKSEGVNWDKFDHYESEAKALLWVLSERDAQSLVPEVIGDA